MLLDSPLMTIPFQKNSKPYLELRKYKYIPSSYPHNLTP
jgi:hypothetical protein